MEQTYLRGASLSLKKKEKENKSLFPRGTCPGHYESSGNKHFGRPINKCMLVYVVSHRTSGSTLTLDSQAFLPTTTCGKPVAQRYWKNPEVPE